MLLCSVLFYHANCTNFFFHDCLADQGDEYEPAPGKVTRRGKLDNYGFWTHGNFVARRKRSGCFSYLPAPRTLFFFELIDKGDDDEVLTCIRLGLYLLASLMHRYLSVAMACTAYVL